MAYLKKIALALVATIFALGMGELLVRVVCEVPEVKPITLSSADSVYQRSSNPLLSYELKANYRCDDPDLNETYESTNSHGLRDRERTLNKPDGVRRIILLGDSVVEGQGIPESSTISRQLEDLLSPDNTEVLNFAVSGYCTRSEAELLETKGLAFDPDIVVLVFTENDFMNFNMEAFLLEGKRSRPAAVKTLFVHSQLFRLAALELNLFGFGSEADPARWNQRAIGENNVVSGLRRLSELSRRHDFLTLVAIWPTFFDTEIADQHFVPGSGSELVIERLSWMNGIPTVRLSEDFVRDFSAMPGGAGPRRRYTRGDRIHPSLDGCRIAARALKTYLAMLTDGHLAAPPGSDEPGQARGDTAAIAAAAALGRNKPNESQVYTTLGLKSLESGDLAQAVAYLRSALEEDPANWKAHYNLGNVLKVLGHREEAVEHYQEALRIKPDVAEAHNNWGNALKALGRPGEALAHYQEALRINPDFATAHYNWGVALEAIGRFQDALEHYQEAVRIKPDFAEAHSRINALRGMGGF